ncbi:hypothetical protein niasHT_006787 [Heterodera trifolii]|uniref:Uncharacterized protein n=1 Tax=Heterodera trifolii TaxID=157864 RepID=A0ABD2M6Z1_9BILA
MELRLIALFILLFFSLHSNVLANLGIKKLFSFGQRSLSDPSNVPLRRSHLLPSRPSHAVVPSGAKLSKPLMITPMHAIELVNLLSTPDLYMDDVGVDSWKSIGTRQVKQKGARGDEVGARIRRNIRKSVREIGSEPVQELHDKAAWMAPNKSSDLSVLYSLLSLGDYLSDQLQLTSDEMREQIEKRSGFVTKWFNKWPNVAEIEDFERGLKEKKRNLAKWSTHLEEVLEKAEGKVTTKEHLKEVFYDAVKVKRITKATDAKDFISICDLAVDERMVKRKLRNTDLTKKSESATLSWASWATKQACKVQIGKKSGKMKEVKDLEGLDMQVCEGIKKGENPNKIAEKMAPQLKRTVDEMDKSKSVQKELRKISAEEMPKRSRRTKRAIWTRKRKRRGGRGRSSRRREKLTIGMRSFMKLRPYAEHYLSARPGRLNARSPGARVRANRRNPRRHKRGSAGHFITCTFFFLLAMFFAINTISAFFAIFSPAFIFAIVATVVLGLITGVVTSAFMGKCSGPGTMGGAYAGYYQQGYGVPYSAHNQNAVGFSGGHGDGGFKLKTPKSNHGYSSAWGMPPQHVYLLEEEYEMKRGRGFSSSASYSASYSESDEYSGGRSVERRKYRRGGPKRYKSHFRERSYDDSGGAEKRVEESEEEKKVRRRTVTTYSRVQN